MSHRPSFAFLMCLLGGAASFGDVINVPEDEPTIQAGIDAAENGDEISVADGVWTGPGNREIEFRGKIITVRSRYGPGGCVIDSEAGGRAFHVHEGETLDAVIDGLTIVNGRTDNGGGGVKVDGASITIRSCRFRDNWSTGGAYSGGALWISAGEATVVDCEFERNGSEDRFGGAAHVTDFTGAAAARFERCTFRHNSAPRLLGGAVAVVGRTVGEIVDSTFEANFAELDGGAVAVVDAAACISRSIFEGNVSAIQGGALDAGGTMLVLACAFRANAAPDGGALVSSSGALAIDRSTFTGNEGSAGGAMHLIGVRPVISNCIFAANRADRGGAIYNSDAASPLLVGCTLTGNESTSGGGAMYSLGKHIHVTPSVSGSVLWGNGPDPVVEARLAFTRVAFSNVEGGWSGAGSNNIDADPRFRSPSDGDFRLAPGSPCIDAADNTAMPAGVDLDLDGAPRFVDDPMTEDTGRGDPPVMDMGAYEFQPACPADLDADGRVGFDDLVMLLAAWGNEGGAEDLDGSGVVDFDDVIVLLAAWGACP